MDEHAGPGVFFNNNNNSVLQSGGGAGKSAVTEGSGAEAARAQYSIPERLENTHVSDFGEYASFPYAGEVGRMTGICSKPVFVSGQPIEAQVAFLHGERKGQENLKKDLVRRIKMLEYALKQERAKYHKLKYGTELNQGEMKPPSYDSDEGNEKDAPGSLSSQLWWKQGRQLLRQYLQEVGYMDTILDVKSQRVKALLGLMGDSSRTKQEPLSNGTDSAPKGANMGKTELSESSAVLEAFKFIESATAEFSDDDDEEDSDGRERTIIVRKKPSSSSSFSPTADVCDDLDTEDALKDFDFLSTSEDMDTSPDSRSADGTDWEKDKQRGTSEAWDVDQVEAITFPPSSGKSFIMGGDEAVESGELGLGELAGLTIANEADNLAYDIGNNKDALRKTWNPKFSLRSHFDAIRGLAFHPTEPVLITASEDHTLKMWNLQKTTPAKKNASLDVEPIYTFRAHRGSVLCVVLNNTGEQCYSGGVDGTVQCWNTPSPNIDPYDSYQLSVLRGALCGHTDAVWGLVYSSAHQRLLSCSADGTVRLWNAANTEPAIAVFNEDKGKLVHSMVAHLDAVTSLAVDPNGLYLMSGSHDCSIRLWNLESKTCIQEFTAHRKKFEESIHDVAFHPSKCYIASAGADSLAKVFV
ncbi:Striatin [Bagarius yarrelli]|uniref:Striatin n=1 Tax=Bagarius yarrelli TaxID=175774 RepID=A0A556U8Y4_BAGYA|nr:Striatin [Bagarius yarrelli]